MTTYAEPATGLGTTEREVGSVFVANYPPFSFWQPEQVEAAERALASPPRPGVDLGLYLHVPFCRKRCKFCYFRVYTDKNAEAIGEYLDAMAREIESYAARPAVAGRPLRFIYVGGGTPSYLSVAQLERVVGRLKAALAWEGAEEVTFECEPGTLSHAKLAAIRGLGVTRLSLGIESFDDEILRENGRAHVGKEIERCLPWIRDVGFPQLNVDLIAGMVGESWESWKRTVARTIEVEPDSVTIYQLELPFNTRYAASLRDGSLGNPLATWDEKREWHAYAIDALAAAGYERSSAYTMVRAGRDVKFVYRNSVWHGCDLIGAGVASFGHINGVHLQNVDSWDEYVGRLREGGSVIARAYATSERERLTRELLLQLKLGEVSGEPFRDKFGVDVLEVFAPALARLAARGMLTVDDDTVRLTRDGLMRVDSLLPELYEEKFRGARYT
ncbi:MAG TPA: coproporphyrinogen-III oxidase family protein [Thermoanaerobaculia bacterium]|nr:coproporphyrinogen-III oxidase family protein [Thermoanaerobaculia bacterium]